MRELVEHAHAGERVRTVEQVLAQYPDAQGVEAVETAHRGDALRARRVASARQVLRRSNHPC